MRWELLPWISSIGSWQGGEEEHISLPCSPVIRESCGCNPHVHFTPPGLHEMPSYATPPAERLAVKDLILLVQRGDYHQMIARLNRALDDTASESGSLHRWNEYLSVVEYKSRNQSTLSAKTLAMLMGGAARALTGDKIGRFQAAKRVAAENSFETLRKVSAMLSGTFEMGELITNLKHGLQLFGIDRGYLVRFLNHNRKARLMMTVQQEVLPPLSAFSMDFPAQQILPPSLTCEWRSQRWSCCPWYILMNHLVIFWSPPLVLFVLHSMMYCKNRFPVT